jgi:hypothetical protein
MRPRHCQDNSVTIAIAAASHAVASDPEMSIGEAMKVFGRRTDPKRG